MLDQNNEFPTEVVKSMGKLDIMGVPYPKKYGGAGLDVISYAIAVEELARVDGGTGLSYLLTFLWVLILFLHSVQRHKKKKYLIPLAKGEKIGAFGFDRTEAGSDAGGTQTTAELDGDHYILNGNKIFITNAPKADTYVVFLQ